MGALTNMARAMLDPIDIAGMGPRRIGRLAAYDGLMLEATGFNQPIGYRARSGPIAADGNAASAPKSSGFPR
jgi:flagellum-specific ATP synthase